MSDGATQLPEAMYPSAPTKLKICSNVLQGWRYDSLTRQIKSFVNQGPQGPRLQVSPFQQVLPSVPSAPVPSDRLALVSQGIVSEARLRSGVLCLGTVGNILHVFVLD